MKRFFLISVALTALLLAGCKNSGGAAPQSLSDILSDISNKKSTGAEVSTSGHALCISSTDLMAFITTSEYGSDAYKTEQAQQSALFEENRCTFISGGVHYDVDADGREIFHTPHGTIAMWPGK